MQSNNLNLFSLPSRFQVQLRVRLLHNDNTSTHPWFVCFSIIVQSDHPKSQNSLIILHLCCDLQVQAKKHGECGTCSTAAGRTTAAPKMSVFIGERSCFVSSLFIHLLFHPFILFQQILNILNKFSTTTIKVGEYLTFMEELSALRRHTVSEVGDHTYMNVILSLYIIQLNLMQSLLQT